MKKLPNAVKWLIIVVVLALMGWMLVAVNDRAASRCRSPTTASAFTALPTLEFDPIKKRDCCKLLFPAKP